MDGVFSVQFNNDYNSRVHKQLRSLVNWYKAGESKKDPAILTGLEKKNPFRTSERSTVPRWHSSNIAMHKEKLMGELLTYIAEKLTAYIYMI